MELSVEPGLGSSGPSENWSELGFTVSREISKVTTGNPCAPLLAFFCDIISCGPIVSGSLPKVVLDIVINFLPYPTTESKFPAGLGVEAHLSNLKGRPDWWETIKIKNWGPDLHRMWGSNELHMNSHLDVSTHCRHHCASGEVCAESVRDKIKLRKNH